MSQNEDALAALVLAQQRALVATETRLLELNNKLFALERTYKSLVYTMPEHDDTPYQCDECELWVHPDDMYWPDPWDARGRERRLCMTCVKT